MPALLHRILIAAMLASFSWLWTDLAAAQTPSISRTEPQGLPPGGTVDVKLRGGNLAGAAELWTSFSGEAILAPDLKDNGKNNGEVVYRVSVPKDVPVGIYGLRVATPGGVSPLKLIAVDDLPSVPQAGDNTRPEAAQALTLPTAVDGTVAALTQNYYKFHAEAGQTVSVEVLARRLGSPLDPMIRILDAQGHELTYSDDEPGLRSDAQLCYTFEQAGDYLIEVRDIRYQGGGNHFYRLRVGDFPCVSVPYPMGVQRGAPATVSFAGEHADKIDPVKLNLPADFAGRWISIGAKRSGGKSSGFATLAVGDRPEFVESEPNDEAAQANRIELGHNINGRFEQSGDVDRFVFAAKKGQKFTFTGITQRQGAPTALDMRLLNAEGKPLANEQDFGTENPVISQTFPADGDYTLELQDLHRRNGPRLAYHVVVEPVEPGFTLTASTDTLNVGAGGTALVTVTCSRTSYNGPVQLAAVDLPAGITSVPTVLGPGMKTVVLTLHAAKDAPASKVFPVKIVGTATIGDKQYKAAASAEEAQKATFNALPWPPNTLTEAAAVAVAPQPKIALRTEPATLVFGRNLSTKVKVIAERQDGFDEAIALAVTPEKGGLPGGVSAELKPIPKGANEIEITFSANDKTPLGEFTAVLVGTIKQGKTTVTEAAPGIGLSLKEPFSLKVDTAGGKLARGGELKIKVSVERNPAFQAAIPLTFANLPKGVTVAAASVPEGQNEVEIVLSAAQDAQQGVVDNVSVKGEAAVGKAKLSATSPAFRLEVE